MSKRVNIQYSVNFDDIPNEVQRMYSDVKNSWNEIQIPEPKNNELMSPEVIKNIDGVRKNLVDLDHMLRDINSIISAYVEFQLAEMREAENTENEQQNADETTEMSE